MSWVCGQPTKVGAIDYTRLDWTWAGGQIWASLPCPELPSGAVVGRLPSRIPNLESWPSVALARRSRDLLCPAPATKQELAGEMVKRSRVHSGQRPAARDPLLASFMSPISLTAWKSECASWLSSDTALQLKPCITIRNAGGSYRKTAKIPCNPRCPLNQFVSVSPNFWKVHILSPAWLRMRSDVIQIRPFLRVVNFGRQFTPHLGYQWGRDPKSSRNLGRARQVALGDEILLHGPVGAGEYYCRLVFVEKLTIVQLKYHTHSPVVYFALYDDSCGLDGM